MSLSVVRAWVVEETGRYDLVNADGSDNGMNKYIVAACRALDMLVGGPKQGARAIQQITVDTYHIDLQDVRSVDEVWIANADDRSKLTRKDLSAIRELYADPESDIDTGTPLYWDVDYSRLAPEQENETEDPDFDGFYDYGTIIFSDTYRKATIYFMPPADGTYTIDVYGKFFQYRLSSDNEVNYWTEVVPDILVRATEVILESGYRDLDHASPLFTILRGLVKGIDADMVEQEIAGITEMEG